VVTFSDGEDNASSAYFEVTPQAAREEAGKALEDAEVTGSYAIGFTSDSNPLSQLVLDLNSLVSKADDDKGRVAGQYSQVRNPSALNSIFSQVASNILASSQVASITTLNNVYTEEEPLYLEIVFTATPYPGQSAGSNYSDTVVAKLVTSPDRSFTIVKYGAKNFVSFEPEIVLGADDVEGRKITIPLTDLTFVKEGQDYYITKIDVKTTENLEDGFKINETTSVSLGLDPQANIGVVLVLDCTSSLGDNFSKVQEAASAFVDTLLSVDSALK
jgi:hypothetical protein